jgi:hypothetical protein
MEARIASTSAVAQTADLDALLVQDHVVFRSTAVGETYGRLSVVALASIPFT